MSGHICISNYVFVAECDVVEEKKKKEMLDVSSVVRFQCYIPTYVHK